MWIAYGTLALASIWRCAYNTDWRVWGHLARAFVLGLGLLPLSVGIAAVLLS